MHHTTVQYFLLLFVCEQEIQLAHTDLLIKRKRGAVNLFFLSRLRMFLYISSKSARADNSEKDSDGAKKFKISFYGEMKHVREI